jgi:Ras-related protein Rab-5C
MEPNPLLSQFKIVILGSAGVGKSSLVVRMSSNFFSHAMQPTVGVSFVRCDVQTPNGTSELSVWDTSGSEKYRAIVPMYYRNAHFAIVVYSVQSRQSLIDVEYWIKQIREHGSASTPICLCANKCDLCEEFCTGNESDLMSVLSKFEIQFLKKTSALTGEGIEDLFIDIASFLLAKHNQFKAKEEVVEQSSVEEGRSCCC